jgi:hypothetical protein
MNNKYIKTFENYKDDSDSDIDVSFERKFDERGISNRVTFGVNYQTSKFGKFIEISGTLMPYNTGRCEEYEFETDFMEEEYEAIYDENWETIEQDIQDEFYKQNP